VGWIAGGTVVLLVVGAGLWRERTVRQAAILAERSRLAKDLHDELGSRLAEVNLLVSVEGQGESTDLGLTGRREAAVRATRESIEAMEQVIWSVKPGNDTLENLVNFMVQYVSSYLVTADLSCDLDLPPSFTPLRLSQDLRKHVVLSMKEALANVVKHAHATRVWIEIKEEGGRLRIVVMDDGRGIAEGTLAPESDGLLNIRERMTACRGSLELGGREGGGTRLQLEVPLRRSWFHRG
jgi:signal transduction histidine kinase